MDTHTQWAQLTRAKHGPACACQVCAPREGVLERVLTLDTCPCQGREHLVCKPGKIETAKIPKGCRGASATTHKFPTLEQAIEEGLIVRESRPWHRPLLGERNNSYRVDVCGTCGRTDWVGPRDKMSFTAADLECLHCYMLARRAGRA